MFGSIPISDTPLVDASKPPRSPRKTSRSVSAAQVTQPSNTISKPRRRSMFGSTPPDDDVAMKQPQQRDRHQEVRHAINAASKPRRRSMFGSTPPDDCPPRHPHQNSLDEVHALDPKPRLHRNMFGGSNRSINSHGSRSSHGSGNGIMNKTNEMVRAILQSPKKMVNTRRRRSLLGNIGSGATEDGDSSQQTERINPPSTPARNRRRRHSLFGNVNSTNTASTEDSTHDQSSSANAAQQQPTTRSRRRHSLLGSGPSTATASIKPKTAKASSANPYELINNERTRRSLHAYSRSMLLDSIARDVSRELAMSGGSKCRPTDYYGNVGKGDDVWTIHQKMMAQKGTEKANIVSKEFYQVGIGMSRGPDQQIYLCQLFQ
jgi:uncharacterized protein YkwD